MSRSGFWACKSFHEPAAVLCPSTAWMLAHRLLWVPHCLWLHKAPSKSIKWLKTTMLGDVGVHRALFRRKRVSGNYIANVNVINETQFEDSSVLSEKTDADQTPTRQSSFAVDIPLQQPARQRNTGNNNQERDDVVLARSPRQLRQHPRHHGSLAPTTLTQRLKTYDSCLLGG